MREAARSAFNSLHGKHEAAVVALGMFLVDSLARNDLVAQAGASLSERTADALPSVFIAPEVSDDLLGKPDHALDQAIAIGGLGGAVLIARSGNTTSRGGVVGTAVGAQALATGANALVAAGHWLTPAEKAREDVGGSAITVALITKFLLDKIAQSEETAKRRALIAGTAAFAGVVTVGAAYLDSKNWKTDGASHTMGVFAGIVSSKLKTAFAGAVSSKLKAVWSSWKSTANAAELSYDAAAETFVAAVENG